MPDNSIGTFTASKLLVTTLLLLANVGCWSVRKSELTTAPRWQAAWWRLPITFMPGYGYRPYADEQRSSLGPKPKRAGYAARISLAEVVKGLVSRSTIRY